MGDEMDKVRTLQVRAGNLLALHHSQLELAELSRGQQFLRFGAVDDLVDRLGIDPRIVADVDGYQGTALADDVGRKCEVRCWKT